VKLAPREVPRWLAKPSAARVILVFGEDRGSVTDLAKRIAQAIVPDLNDPFSVALLDADSVKGEPSRLHDEFFALAPLGGKKLIRFRDAVDRHTGLIEQILAEPAGASANVLLVEAGELTFRSTLKKLCEGHTGCVVIGCDQEQSGDIEAFIRETLLGEQLKIEPDASAFLAQRLGGDRAMLRRALDVLALYKQDDPGQDITVADVRATTGDSESLGLDAVLDALLAGTRAGIDRALTKALQAGTTPVGILRGALRSFQRIQMVSALKARGASDDQALSGMFPPIPYSGRGAFLAACRRWSPEAAGRVLRLLNEAEAQCKTTGLPEAVICSQILLRIPGLTEKRPAA